MLEIIFTIVPIFIIVVFAFVILNIISPKFRGKIMSHQVKSLKHMIDYSQEDLQDIIDNMEYATHNSTKNKARAVKEGFGEDTVYCKHCGISIDIDSKFCKRCGKEQ